MRAEGVFLSSRSVDTIQDLVALSVLEVLKIHSEITPMKVPTAKDHGKNSQSPASGEATDPTTTPMIAPPHTMYGLDQCNNNRIPATTVNMISIDTYPSSTILMISK